jgi:hypothetical protein
MKQLLLFLLLGVVFSLRANAKKINLVQNPGFETVVENSSPSVPADYELQGAASWGLLGTSQDIATNGIIFPGGAQGGGGVSQLIRSIDQSKGRWITFRFRGLPERNFVIGDDSLKIKIEFYSKNGTNYLDCASRTIYSEIVQDRKDLDVNGDYHKYGAAVWRSYELEELIPFPEVDAVKISVSYASGASTEPLNAALLLDDFSLAQHKSSQTGRVDPATRIPSSPAASVDEKNLISLGGRWYYAPELGETVSIATTPLVVTEKNADHLYYKSDRFITPFANNMTSWLRVGHKDATGMIVTQDRFVPDNVVITFKGDGFLTMHSKNIPNHPTAKFPGFNPSYIQEQNMTYRLPLEPVLNPDAIVTDAHDTNRALPMGPIGVAINGVAFFNPFDANMGDASNIMDYCCGHPNPDNFYHYHKYPICVNTPFVDKGDAPSEVIGFAFDGLPIYGPYQDKGIMAKDSETNPLNAFNACYDDARGWHYHVTPGKFPYLIGGYLAKAEPSNIMLGPRHPSGSGFGGPPPGQGPE